MASSTVLYMAVGMCAMMINICSTQEESRELGNWCPTFWTPFEEACFRLIAKPETWADAEAKCQQLGKGIISRTDAHLVSIHNQDERDFVQAYYESSVVVQGKQKETTDPNSYNSLWLGLNNQGPNLDSFVWSDKTEISTTFWQDALYEINHNCGHTWTSSPSNKLKWNDAVCTTKLPYICKLVPTQQDDSDIVDESSCSYHDTIIKHGETLTLNECTSCTCNNATVKCNNKTCPPTSCEEPVKPAGECCDVCPGELSTSCFYRGKYYLYGETWTPNYCTSCTCNTESTVHCEIQQCPVIRSFCSTGDDPITIDGECCTMCPLNVPVYDVQVSGDGVNSVTAGTVNDLSVDLQVSLTIQGQSVLGSGLWKVGMYVSSNADGSGKKIGFKEQVLTDEQASRDMITKRYAGFEFLIPDIDFSLDASNTTCDQLQYLCASFNKGDAPETLSWGLQVVPQDISRFEVYGVEPSEDYTSRNPARLVGCQPFTNCKDKDRKCLRYKNQ